MTRLLATRFAAIAGAAIIVFGAATVVSSRFSHQPESYSAVPESVSVVQRILTQPKLAVSAPRSQVAANQNAPSPKNAPQIARTGKVTLFVSDVPNAVKHATEIANQESGAVFSLQSYETGGPDGAPSADMEIRVDASRFDGTIAAIRKLGKVREHTVSAEDLTGDLTDSAARLTNLRRTEADMRNIMDRSGSVGQILNVEEHLSDVRGQIESLEAQLKSMRGRVAYATISVSMEAEAAPAPVEPGAAAQLAAAWSGATHALWATAIGIAAAILWLVVFIPLLAAAAAAVYAVYAFVRRRRRHSVQSIA